MIQKGLIAYRAGKGKRNKKDSTDQEKGGVKTMKEMTHKIIRFLSSYKGLFFLWVVVGIMTLAAGNISRLNYLCVWLVLLMEYLFKAIDEK